jgi:hypothetical protein
MKPIKEIIFLVEEATEGGYIAQALGESIFTEADTDTLEEFRFEPRNEFHGCFGICCQI